MTLKTRSGDLIGKGSPLVVSIPELSRLTGISEGLLYIKANSGELPGCRRIGKRFCVHLATFEEYLKAGMGVDR